MDREDCDRELGRLRKMYDAAQTDGERAVYASQITALLENFQKESHGKSWVDYDWATREAECFARHHVSRRVRRYTAPRNSDFWSDIGAAGVIIAAVIGTVVVLLLALFAFSYVSHAVWSTIEERGARAEQAQLTSDVRIAVSQALAENAKSENGATGTSPVASAVKDAAGSLVGAIGGLTSELKSEFQSLTSRRAKAPAPARKPTTHRSIAPQVRHNRTVARSENPYLRPRSAHENCVRAAQDRGWALSDEYGGSNHVCEQ